MGGENPFDNSKKKLDWNKKYWKTTLSFFALQNNYFLWLKVKVSMEETCRRVGKKIELSLLLSPTESSRMDAEGSLMSPRAECTLSKAQTPSSSSAAAGWDGHGKVGLASFCNVRRRSVSYRSLFCKSKDALI